MSVRAFGPNHGVEKLVKPEQLNSCRRLPVTIRIGKPLRFGYTDDYV